MKLLIEILEVQKKMVDAIMELPPQVENDLISAIRHGKPFPDGATNGDVIKAMFPNIPLDENNFLVRKSRHDNTEYWKDWWNAPYKGGESE